MSFVSPQKPGQQSFSGPGFTQQGVSVAGCHFLSLNGLNQYLNIASPSSVLAFGDQDFWWNVWFRFNGGDSDQFQAIVGKAQLSGDQREWGTQMDDVTGRLWTRVSTDGTDAGWKTAVGPPITNAWTCLLGFYDSVANEVGTIINNGTPITTAAATVFLGTGGFSIGAFNSGANPFRGDIASLTCGSTADGLTDTFPQVADFFYQNDRRLRYTQLTPERRTKIGITEMWDFCGNTPLVGQHGATVLTNNNSALFVLDDEDTAIIPAVPPGHVMHGQRVPARFVGF